MSNKKYQSEVLQESNTWTARITRQITSRKSLVSKQQEGFKSEVEAQAWAETTMAEFVTKQKSANQRQGLNRKEQEEVRRQRSSRRAEKTELAKQAKEQAELEDVSDINTGTDDLEEGSDAFDSL